MRVLYSVELRVTRMVEGKPETELTNVSFRRYDTKREAFQVYEMARAAASDVVDTHERAKHADELQK